jgi:hypothetical protein
MQLHPLTVTVGSLPQEASLSGITRSQPGSINVERTGVTARLATAGR